MLAAMHSRKGTVIAGRNLLKLLEQRLANPIPLPPYDEISNINKFRLL
ncbi:protein of unknown function [Legionella micdadei]|uniref:Uncharacterized protein n=2 Tax=Legionella micdadei TaxID=451 RepID=A0A098GC01_LEGMI|nr:protein of unknown function [Legionella micdadei]